MNKLTKACKNRPKGCKCDPRMWEGWRVICGKFTRNRSEPSLGCKHCEHEPECHSE